MTQTLGPTQPVIRSIADAVYRMFRRALLLVIGMACFAASPPIATAQASAGSKGTLLIYGDSLSASYGIDVQRGWPTLLTQWLTTNGPRLRVVNRSLSGETTHGGLQRMKRALIQENPSIVILALGANDGLRGLSLTQTEENLRQMIRLAKSHGARVLLVGIALPPNYGEDFTRRFAAIYPRLSRELAVPLVPFMLEGFATDLSYFQADRIHPNERAQPLILETILGGLVPMLRATP